MIQTGICTKERGSRFNEYRYDPIYLYRLTNCVFDEDYTKSHDDVFGLGPNTFSSFGAFFGDIQAEVAVCLERIYKEGKELDIGDNPPQNQDELMSGYDYMNGDFVRNRAKIMARHTESKFSRNQSDTEYVQDLEPYLIKFAYIDAVGISAPFNAEKCKEFFGMDDAEYNEKSHTFPPGEEYRSNELLSSFLFSKLLEKYNVRTMYSGE